MKMVSEEVNYPSLQQGALEWACMPYPFKHQFWKYSACMLLRWKQADAAVLMLSIKILVNINLASWTRKLGIKSTKIFLERNCALVIGGACVEIDVLLKRQRLLSYRIFNNHEIEIINSNMLPGKVSLKLPSQHHISPLRLPWKTFSY